MLWVNLWIRFTGGWITTRGGEESDLLAAFIDQETGPFAGEERHAHQRA